MNKLLLLLTFTLSALISKAQQVDTLIHMAAYKSYYSYQVKNPLYVTYTLSKGGGDCNRAKFSFQKCGIKTADDDDYFGTGYDKGHLANAEDFAYNCSLDKETFCYYNCVPQTTKLNRGIWKTWETKVRKLSQSKPVFVIAGAIYTDQLLKEGHTVVKPDYCYKIIVDPPTGNILYCLLFPNDESGRVEALSLSALKAKLPYPLVP
ncbi:MAG TPA: DNA/RNA non-specific endonuclease [Pedobacter sp.]